jgi:hypothetical protein
LEPVGVGTAAVAEEREHGGAGINSHGAEVWLLRKEAGQETAVAVAEEEGLVAGREIGEEVGAGALEEWAQGEVFGECVDAGYGVEVGRRWLIVEPGQGQVQIQGSLHCAALRSR